jgi:His-Xaa-Ser system protein HxsD
MIIDKRIYDDACISKAVYYLSDEMPIIRTFISDSEEQLDIKCPLEQKEQFENKLVSVLNDYKLRGIIESETHDIKTILYAKAFIDDEELNMPEDYV